MGVVALADEHRDVARVGGEVGAGLTDRFVVTVHLGWSLAPAVAEHALVLLAEPPHVGAFGVGGELGVVEVIDFRRDRVVFVGDGVVSDAGIDQGHLEVLVT